MINCCNDIDNYALTGSTSIYGEDKITAQQVLITTVKKVKECVAVCEELTNNIDNLLTERIVTYPDGAMSIYLEFNGFKAKTPGYRWHFLFNENAKSPIEVAGNVNCAINECLNVLNTVVARLLDYPTIEKALNELKTAVNGSYVDVYNECAMTYLELAGSTAKAVNDLVKLLNSLEETVTKIAVLYNGENEELTMLVNLIEEETITGV